LYVGAGVQAVLALVVDCSAAYSILILLNRTILRVLLASPWLLGMVSSPLELLAFVCWLQCAQLAIQTFQGVVGWTDHTFHCRCSVTCRASVDIPLMRHRNWRILSRWSALRILLPFVAHCSLTAWCSAHCIWMNMPIVVVLSTSWWCDDRMILLLVTLIQLWRVRCFAWHVWLQRLNKLAA